MTFEKNTYSQNQLEVVADRAALAHHVQGRARTQDPLPVVAVAAALVGQAVEEAVAGAAEAEAAAVVEASGPSAW